MTKKIIFLALCSLLLAPCSAVEAQQPAKVPRIEFLGGVFPSAVSDRIGAFRHGLRELGYVEGKNILVEYRYAEDRLDRLPALAAELVGLKVDVILTGGPGSTGAAREATVRIPIVMAQDTDPVGTGYIASLARPGGNITGLATFAPEISGKQLELLKEMVPKLSRVAVLGTSSTPGTAQTLRETEIAAGAAGVKLQSLDVLASNDIEIAFRASTKGRADALLVLANPVLNSQRIKVVDLAAKSRLPAIYPFPEFVEAGGLMSYGVSFYRFVPARRHVCGQDPERHKTCRSAGRAAEEVRVHHQSESR
jgi:putative tryptophan/tyrosine transport system substrate-binding protein